jgi:hypothetical protein
MYLFGEVGEFWGERNMYTHTLCCFLLQYVYYAEVI